MVQFPSNTPSRAHTSRNLTFAFVLLSLLVGALYYSTTQREAKILSPQKLLKRPLATDLTTVPKLFHQSWKTDELPEKFEKWSRSCRKAHPDWEWVLWTDDDNWDLIMQYAPWFEETYEALGDRMPVFRVDVIRNIYMHVFGGVYADLDVECLAPTETLIEKHGQPGRQAFLGRMGTDNNSVSSLPNAWFASTPGHPFWLLPIDFVQDNFNKIHVPEQLTGPEALFNVIKDYQGKIKDEDDILDHRYRQSGWRHLFPQPARHNSSSNCSDSDVTILPWWEIYPYSWERDGEATKDYCWTRMDSFDARKCKEILGTDHWGTHFITYWSHSWADVGDGHDDAMHKSLGGEIESDEDDDEYEYEDDEIPEDVSRL